MHFQVRHVVEHIIEGDPHEMTVDELKEKVGDSYKPSTNDGQLVISGLPTYAIGSTPLHRLVPLGFEDATFELVQKPCSPFELKFMMNGSEASITVTWGDCVRNVKAEIEKTFGVNTRIQRFLVNSEEVKDHEMLRDILTVSPCSVELQLNLGKIVMFSIKTMTGWTTEVACADSSTIDGIKTIIQDKTGLPPDQQRLVFNHQDLKNELKLSDYGIHDGDSVFPGLTLRGCGCGCGQNNYVQGEMVAIRDKEKETDSKSDGNADDSDESYEEISTVEDIGKDVN